MSDRSDTVLARARADAMRDVLPPGADQVRRTVRRRRGVTAACGAAAAVLVMVSGIAVFGTNGPVLPAPAGPPSEPSARVYPMPDPTVSARLNAVSAALGDPDKLPWVMATAAVVTPDYENDINDMPADEYRLFLYCLGRGKADVVVKAGQYGNKVLATGTVTCTEQPAPATLAVRQPVDGYLRVFLRGDAEASVDSVFSFKFVHNAELMDQAGSSGATPRGR
jgi:hypothetical protein